MQRRFYVAPIVAALAFAGILVAQPQPPASRAVQLFNMDEVLPYRFDWNAICQVKTNNHILWMVGDSGHVRKYEVLYSETTGLPYISGPLEDYQLGGTNSTCKLMDVCFPTESWGYIVGYIEEASSNLWKGKIWYTHNGGGSASDWLEPQALGIPAGDVNIPCLSVDFYDYQHGYVGCGLGFVIMTVDGGVNWALTPEQPWEGLTDIIPDIPKHNTDLGYFNRYGDWYWSIKTLKVGNNVHIYVASDNNGVFYKTTDGGATEWTPFCFGQDQTYGDAYQYVRDVLTGSEMFRDTSFEVLSLDLQMAPGGNDTRLMFGGTHGRVIYRFPNPSEWRTKPALITHWQDVANGKTALGWDTCVWINGVNQVWPTQYWPNEDPSPQAVGSSGYGFMSSDYPEPRAPLLDWYSEKYALNDVVSCCPLGPRPGEDVTNAWWVGVGDNRAILWHREAYKVPEGPPESPTLTTPTVEIVDLEGDNGGSVDHLSLGGNVYGIESCTWKAHFRPNRNNWGLNPITLQYYYLFEETLATLYWPPFQYDGPNGLETVVLPGYPQPYRVYLDYTDPWPDQEAIRTNSEAGDDDSFPCGSQLIPPWSFSGRWIEGGCGLPPDSHMVELIWKPITFEEDSTLAGYFICPVSVHRSYVPYPVETLYTYYSYPLETQPFCTKPRYTLKAEVWDPVKLIFNLHLVPVDPPDPGTQRLSHTAPLRRNVWHGYCRKPNPGANYMGEWYAVLPVDYNGNVGDERYPNGEHHPSGFSGWSPWFFVEWPGPSGISESNASPPIPFALEVIGPTINQYYATVNYSLPQDAEVSLNLYDVTGRRVKSIANGRIQAGYHTTEIPFFDDKGLALANGVYFVRFFSGDRKITRKIVVSH